MATTSRGRRIPEATVARLPVYLRILLDQSEVGHRRTSRPRSSPTSPASTPPRCARTSATSARYGTRGVGYEVEYLDLPGPPRARPDPRLAGRHRRRRQPRPGARRLRRVRRARLPGRRHRRHRPGQGRHGDRRRRASAHVDDLATIVRANDVSIGVVATPGRGGPGGRRPARRGRRHEHPQLRAGRARRRRRRQGAQGRPRRRAADPQLLRAAPRGRRRGRRCRRYRPVRDAGASA